MNLLTILRIIILGYLTFLPPLAISWVLALFRSIFSINFNI